MAFGVTRDPRLRDVALLGVGALGTAAAITLMYLGMRAVMDIGGACADGGPYVPAQRCPEGVAFVMVFASLGLFLFGGIATWYGMKVGGIWSAAPLFAWAGLFLSLGWNFLDFGVVNPPFDDGVVWGWAIPGVMFIVMGAAPLVFAVPALGSVRRPTPDSPRGGPPVIRTVPLGPAPVRPASPRTGGDDARERELRAIATDIEGAVALAMATTPAAPDADEPPGAAAFEEGTQALLDRLERLADMRDRGLLGADEYETAKEAVMRELERRS